VIRAVLFDVGGVIFSSPFDAFARYERDNNLPADFIRTLNATNPHENAWAHLERGDVEFDEFCDLFEKEAAAAGNVLDARAVMACLSGDIRPEMLEAVRRCHARLKTAMLTNNIAPMERSGVLFEHFDVIVESSTAGVRKPDPRFYEIALTELAVAADEAVFLDDLGINLKPARDLGMTTIKVVDPATAIADLETVVGFPLRD
jgi:putative hydrolase of the HAD superfamily